MYGSSPVGKAALLAQDHGMLTMLDLHTCLQQLVVKRDAEQLHGTTSTLDLKVQVRLSFGTHDESIWTLVHVLLHRGAFQTACWEREWGRT